MAKMCLQQVRYWGCSRLYSPWSMVGMLDHLGSTFDVAPVTGVALPPTIGLTTLVRRWLWPFQHPQAGDLPS